MPNSLERNRRQVLGGLTSAALAPLAASSLSNTASAQQSITRPAPQWDILEWINGDGGNVETLRGRVIVIDFFQLWCPGCNKFSGPLMSYWERKFAGDIAERRLHLVKIHTVFEGHNYQTVRRLKKYVKEKGITIPVGIDRHAEGRRVPETMRRYNTRGTPEMAIIDKDGMVRFQQFGYFEVEKVEPMLDTLIRRDKA